MMDLISKLKERQRKYYKTKQDYIDLYYDYQYVVIDEFYKKQKEILDSKKETYTKHEVFNGLEDLYGKIKL